MMEFIPLCGNPWGMVLDGRSGNFGITNEKYKFTGKERDDETNYDYFGARYYDARIGRWLGVDPLAEKYLGWSPFNYCVNNPLIVIDPDGTDWYKKNNGLYIYDPNLSDSNKDKLREGETYMGATFTTDYATFNDDGSALFTNTTKAIEYMLSVQNGLNKEQLGMLNTKGEIFMLPNFLNSEGSASMTEYGYSINNYELKGSHANFKLLSSIHTHPKTGGTSEDDIAFNYQLKKHPWFTIETRTNDINVYVTKRIDGDGAYVYKRLGHTPIKTLIESKASLKTLYKKYLNPRKK